MGIQAKYWFPISRLTNFGRPKKHFVLISFAVPPPMSGKHALALSWNPKKGNLDQVAPGKSIGGDIFRNEKGLLPQKDGRVWFEADIGYVGGFRSSERLVFSNDGLIYFSRDHYKTFKYIGER